MASRKKNPHETRTGNYLLRSTRRDSLLDIMALVHVGRLSQDQVNAILVKSDNTWAGYASWEARTLSRHGLIRRADGVRNGRRCYELTTLGHAALAGALTALGRRLDTAELVARLDATRVG